MEDDRKTLAPGRLASPPCMADEVAPDYFDPLWVDPQQRSDVARWRVAERTRLRAARDGLDAPARRRSAEQISTHVRNTLAEIAGDLRGRVLSGFWPIKGEPDLRPLFRDLHAAGVRIALPLVETRAAPLVFRLWTPETRMVRGFWKIPVPPTDAPVAEPDILLAPLLGWDGAGFRLGYGGGYFDRTLAAADPTPRAIGVGYQSARLATIYPQPHDIPMDAIVTEAGRQEIAG